MLDDVFILCFVAEEPMDLVELLQTANFNFLILQVFGQIKRVVQHHTDREPVF